LAAAPQQEESRSRRGLGWRFGTSFSVFNLLWLSPWHSHAQSIGKLHRTQRRRRQQPAPPPASPRTTALRAAGSAAAAAA